MITTEKIEKMEHELSLQLKRKYPNADIYLYDYGDDLKLDTLRVPKENRNQGIGSSIMNDITNYADKTQKRTILTLGQKEKGGTTSSGRLARFYGRFGFERNKGRNKDFTVSASMIRRPMKKIEKVVEFDDLTERAKKHFGTTKNPFEAGYITHDGHMLDFSGRHWNKNDKTLAGHRYVDHRDVRDIVDDAPNPNDSSSIIGRFQSKANALRVHISPVGGMNVMVHQDNKITPHQYKTLESIHGMTGGRIYHEIERPGQFTSQGTVQNISNLKRRVEFGFKIPKLMEKSGARHIQMIGYARRQQRETAPRGVSLIERIRRKLLHEKVRSSQGSV